MSSCCLNRTSLVLNGVIISSIVSFNMYNLLKVLNTPRLNSARLSTHCKSKGNRNVPVLQMSNPDIVLDTISIIDASRSLNMRNFNAVSDASPR